MIILLLVSYNITSNKKSNKMGFRKKHVPLKVREIIFPVWFFDSEFFLVFFAALCFLSSSLSKADTREVSFYCCFLFSLELWYFGRERGISLLKARDLKPECLPLSFGDFLIGLLLRLHIVNVDFELLLYLYTRFVRYDNPMIRYGV